MSSASRRVQEEELWLAAFPQLNYFMGGHTCTKGKPPMKTLLHAPPEEAVCEVHGA